MYSCVTHIPVGSLCFFFLFCFVLFCFFLEITKIQCLLPCVVCAGNISYVSTWDLFGLLAWVTYHATSLANLASEYFAIIRRY